MMDVFKNRSVVDALQQKCKDDHTEHKPLHRRHPRVPHCTAAHQFLTDIEDSLVETCEKVLKKGATITMQADGAAGEALVRETIAKSASAFPFIGRIRTSKPPAVAAAATSVGNWPFPAIIASRVISLVNPFGNPAALMPF